MKYIKSKLLQKPRGRKQGKYLITLEVTDNDLNMLENFATTMAPFKETGLTESQKLKSLNKPESWYLPEFNDKYMKWISKTFHEFLILWKKYDKYD